MEETDKLQKWRAAEDAATEALRRIPLCGPERAQAEEEARRLRAEAERLFRELLRPARKSFD